jgi:hypothetical protein
VLQDIDPANPLLRSNPEPGRAPSEEAASRMIAEIRPIIRRNSEAVVYSNGALIGQPGRRDEVRLLPGGVADAQQLFNSLTRLGYRQVFVLTGQYSSGGTFVELPGGGTVGLRINNAGLPTVDVNVPGVPPVRYHFVK